MQVLHATHITLYHPTPTDSAAATTMITALSRPTTMITVCPVMHDDAEALAKIRREAFAGTVISQLISGNVDPIQGLEVGTRTLLGMLRKPNRTLRKAVVEGDESSRAIPLGMSIFDLVDAAASAPAKSAAHGAVEVESDDSSVEERPEPAPGTDLDRLHEFVAMLEGMLKQYKQYDSRFYST